MTKKIDYLDGEMLFKYYFQTMGTARSIDKLIRYCESTGIVHPVSGKPPTRMGVYKCMWRWATSKDNQKKAFEIYNASELDGFFEYYDDWNQWKEFLKERVSSAYQHEKGTDRYLRNNELS